MPKTSRVKSLLSQKPKGKKVSRNYHISVEVAEKFSAYCEAGNVSPSELVEAMMEDHLYDAGAYTTPAPKAVKKPVAKKEDADVAARLHTR